MPEIASLRAPRGLEGSEAIPRGADDGVGTRVCVLARRFDKQAIAQRSIERRQRAAPLRITPPRNLDTPRHAGANSCVGLKPNSCDAYQRALTGRLQRSRRPKKALQSLRCWRQLFLRLAFAYGRNELFVW